MSQQPFGAAVAELTSTRNPRVRALVALHHARDRREAGQHLVEGPHAVEAAIRAGVVDEVFVTHDAPQVAIPQGVSATIVSDHVMERLSDARTPQGIVAVARTPHASLEDVPPGGLLVVLDHVADPGNVGTIIRTADAAGAAAVAVTPGSADVFAPKSIRAAAGSTYHLPVAAASIDGLLVACRSTGRSLVGLDGRAERSIFDLEPGDAGVALVLGNEAHGLSDQVTAEADVLAAVPIDGQAESLNVAAAAAVAIYAAAHGLHRSS